ncbi:MAG: L,D-transpeptidase/peptidoglycan binding protein [Lachnospiraceae bacterium]|nr:L,D-transpeptidase/peptidoglycan binding protein [Lachnospiraceae bacterium]
MRKFLLGFIRIVCVMAVLGIGAVIALDQYYQHVFPMFVTINGIYCTGMTVKNVTEVLDDSYDLHSDRMTVRTLDGKIHEMPLDEYGVTISYQPAVAECMVQCKSRPFQWLGDCLNYWLNWSPPRIYVFQEETVYPTYYCDTAIMAAKLEEAAWLNDNLYSTEKTVSIMRSTTEGYILVDETKDLLLKEDAVELICEKIVNHLTKMNNNPFQTTLIDLATGADKESCYKNAPYTDEMKDTLAKWKGISDFQDFHMTYQFGDCEEVIDANVVADWMALDEEGNIVYDENNIPVLDKTMIAEYVAYLSTSYNTVGIERKFKATRGDIVTVSGGGYGNEIDEKAEYEFLLNAFLNKESGTRTPQYLSEAWEKGTDDIGDTYIEVDMGSQHMYYYVDGALVIDTPIVTGNTSRRWGTPAKVCFVYFKQKNRVLRGTNYATPVKYWMAVDGHIGIHDAAWRREFGGEIYKTNGSHGCINTPLEIMTELYDLVELGTPVIMFY